MINAFDMCRFLHFVLVISPPHTHTYVIYSFCYYILNYFRIFLLFQEREKEATWMASRLAKTICEADQEFNISLLEGELKEPIIDILRLIQVCLCGVFVRVCWGFVWGGYVSLAFAEYEFIYSLF